MTFSSTVKTDLAEISFGKKCCMRAEAYGILLFAKSFTMSNISVQTDNHAIAQRIVNLVKKLCFVAMKMSRGETGVYLVSAQTPEDRKKILDFFGKSIFDTVSHINRANINPECDDCIRAFLRGCFLVTGSISDPEKSYHFELSVTRKKLCDDLLVLLSEYGITPKLSSRRNSYVLYLKRSEDIEDILTFMGAANEALELMGVKIMKDIKNRENRRNNCDVANIEKTAKASIKHCKAIAYIEKVSSLDVLPADLREVAVLRRDNPEMSLSQMGENLEPKLTRSGVNRRLDKIMQIAEELENKSSKEQ